MSETGRSLSVMTSTLALPLARMNRSLASQGRYGQGQAVPEVWESTTKRVMTLG